MNWTLQHIEDLKAKGKIKDYVDTKPPKKEKRLPAAKKLSPQKTFIANHLKKYCSEEETTLVEEHKFSHRKFRFDWCIPEQKIAIEYNGIMSRKSRHTTVGGYSRDMTKINLAQSLGWIVYQYTPLNYEDIINDIPLKSKVYS